jgi:hypothetical protein
LTPKQKDEVRTMIKDFKNLPQDRRQAVKEELDHLNKLSPQERNQRLNSEEFRNKFSRDERKILTNTSAALLSALSPEHAAVGKGAV